MNPTLEVAEPHAAPAGPERGPDSAPRGPAKGPPTGARIFLRPLDHLVLAVWYGVAAGLGEVAVFLLKCLTHKVTRFPPETIWMAPLADAVFFAIPGGLAALLTWKYPRLISVRVAGGCLTALASFVVLL